MQILDKPGCQGKRAQFGEVSTCQIHGARFSLSVQKQAVMLYGTVTASRRLGVLADFHASLVATTQNHYIKTTSPDAIAAMKQFSEALLCSTYVPDGNIKTKGSVQ
jgi:hypothetical protein